MRRVATVVVVGLVTLGTRVGAGEATRGVGVYPGRPEEHFGAELVAGSTTYRNLALQRAAYQSSAYDSNLTAQLATDGIIDTRMPRFVAVGTDQGPLGAATREFVFDQNSVSSLDLTSTPAWVVIELGGGADALTIHRVELEAHTRRHPMRLLPGASQDEALWAWTIAASDDGKQWRELGRMTGSVPPAPPRPKVGDWSGFYAWMGEANPVLRPSLTLPQPTRVRFLRLSLDAAAGEAWALAEVNLFDGEGRLRVGGPHSFTSAWMPEGKGEEWVSVDLGAPSSFDRVRLHWVRRAAEGAVEVSDDGQAWRSVCALPNGTGTADDLRLETPVSARYVRVRMTRPASPDGYVLSEVEVMGRGGLVPRPRRAPPARADGGLDLAGGNWRLQRASLVEADGATLSRPGFVVADWVVATVPGTVLSSYWDTGAIPDPNYGDNQLMISDSFFHSDFWYRTEFEGPRAPSRRIWLDFDGVNWKAEVYLNGEKLGRVEGGFMRGRFDVTRLVRPGKTNALAVRIERNATPGSAKQKTLETPGLNGGALGADNPTYHASIGWDWIPTVRGRNIGIWNDVRLTISGTVTLGDAFVKTTLPLPDTSQADVRIEVPVWNHSSKTVNGRLIGLLGDVPFETSVEIAAEGTKTVVLDPTTHPALRFAHPKLWWPAGYGDPHLYDLKLKFETAEGTSDTRSLRPGLRQFTYSEDGGVLRIWVNGRRFVGRGGNWGFPETNLRYRAREYDTAVRLHRDMNFTMIRNWVGQTGDEEFFEACDRYGIVVWQDFWLANPVDGPNPDDNALFLANARDSVLKMRGHASLGLYCGRNEGDPPPPLDEGLREIIGRLHDDSHYISNSAFGVVSGGGPYDARSPKEYFRTRATPRLHSELGMPDIVGPESLRQMVPENALWPPGLVWGLHDFNLQGAQRLTSFRRIIDDGYGGGDDPDLWVRLAQFVNYDGYRAMFEAQGKNRMGLLLWMSHPAWPSFVWQTYDYFFDPTAGYFGAKKGSEPLHIQWNADTDAVEVVNYSVPEGSGLVARAEILTLHGSKVWEREASLDAPEDSVREVFPLVFPEGLTPVHFVRLRLTRGVDLVSENLYWRGSAEGRFEALRSVPKVDLEAVTDARRDGDRWVLTTEISNPSAHPALLVRVGVARGKTGDRILPAIFSDNYVFLMPGERRTIRTEVEDMDARGELPRITVDGLNVGAVSVR